RPAFRAVPGVRAVVQSRPWRALAADAADAGVLRRHAGLDPDRLPRAAAGDRRDDLAVPRLSRRRAAAARALFLTARRRHGRRTRSVGTLGRADPETARRRDPA